MYFIPLQEILSDVKIILLCSGGALSCPPFPVAHLFPCDVTFQAYLTHFQPRNQSLHLAARFSLNEKSYWLMTIWCHRFLVWGLFQWSELRCRSTFLKKKNYGFIVMLLIQIQEYIGLYFRLIHLTFASPFRTWKFSGSKTSR